MQQGFKTKCEFKQLDTLVEIYDEGPKADPPVTPYSPACTAASYRSGSVAGSIAGGGMPMTPPPSAGMGHAPMAITPPPPGSHAHAFIPSSPAGSTGKPAIPSGIKAPTAPGSAVRLNRTIGGGSITGTPRATPLQGMKTTGAPGSASKATAATPMTSLKNTPVGPSASKPAGSIKKPSPASMGAYSAGATPASRARGGTYTPTPAPTKTAAANGTATRFQQGLASPTFGKSTFGGHAGAATRPTGAATGSTLGGNAGGVGSNTFKGMTPSPLMARRPAAGAAAVGGAAAAASPAAAACAGYTSQAMPAAQMQVYGTPEVRKAAQTQLPVFSPLDLSTPGGSDLTMCFGAEADQVAARFVTQLTPAGE